MTEMTCMTIGRNTVHYAKMDPRAPKGYAVPKCSKGSGMIAWAWVTPEPREVTCKRCMK